MECSKCGAELDLRDAFCSQCGEVTDRGKGASELAGRYAAETADGIGKLISAIVGYVTDPENRIKVAVSSGIALLLLISLTSNPISRGVGSIFASSPDAPTFNDDGSPNFANYEDVFIGEQVEYLVTGPANVRDFPTSQGTNVIGSLADGEKVMAREVQAFDPSSQWLKLATGGYVWGSNLISIEQIEHEAINSTETVNEFPDFLHGTWSSMDTCRGGSSNAEVRISDSRIQYSESVGMLTNVRVDDQGNTIYEVTYESYYESWNDSLAITITENRLSIIIDSVSNTAQPGFAYHKTEAGCGGVFFLDE